MAEDETNPPGVAGGERGVSLRLFFAVGLPVEIREAAEAHAARLRQEFPAASAGWPRPESLHLTLKFLGEVEATRLDALHHAAVNAAAGLDPFALTVEGAGTFPTRGAARVLWLGVRDDSGQLSRLQFRLDKECAHAGFPRETRAFKPHLTVARLRASRDAHALSEAHRLATFGPYDFEVSELLLVRSQLGRGGSRYTILSSHAL